MVLKKQKEIDRRIKSGEDFWNTHTDSPIKLYDDYSVTVQTAWKLMDEFADNKAVAFAEWLRLNYNLSRDGCYWYSIKTFSNPQKTAELYEKWNIIINKKPQ